LLDRNFLPIGSPNSPAPIQKAFEVETVNRFLRHIPSEQPIVSPGELDQPLMPAIENEPPVKGVKEQEDCFTVRGHTTLVTSDYSNNAVVTDSTIDQSSVAATDATEVDADKPCRSSPKDLWRQHSGLYDGTGYGDEEIAMNTPLPASDIFSDDAADITHAIIYEESAEDSAPDTNTNTDVEEHAKPESLAGEQSPIDEREALQEIIRAYAAPMYEDEVRETRASHLVARLSDEEAMAYGNEMKDDVAESIGMMNRSLGG